MNDVRKNVSQKRGSVPISRTRTGVRTRSVRLGERRRIMRRRKIVLVFILTIFFFVVIIVFLQRPFLRVTHISVVTPDNISNSVATSLVKKSLSGKYFFSIPYNSALFLHSSRARGVLLKTFPTVAAVSIARNGISAMTITLEPRAPLSRWCGTAASSTPANTIQQDTRSLESGQCYLFDSGGFLFMKIATSTPTTSTPATPPTSNTQATTPARAPLHRVRTASSPVNTSSSQSLVGSIIPLFPYVVYAPLVATGTPYLNTIAHDSTLSHVFDLAQRIRIFHITVSTIVLRGDEVDLFLTDGTRITYVRGDERSAFSLLSSVVHDISLSDGSLEYVDLRFPGKVYFRKR